MEDTWHVDAVGPFCYSATTRGKILKLAEANPSPFPRVALCTNESAVSRCNKQLFFSRTQECHHADKRELACKRIPGRYPVTLREETVSINMTKTEGEVF